MRQLQFDIRPQTVLTEGKEEERLTVFVKYKDGAVEKEAPFKDYIKQQGEHYVGLLTVKPPTPPAGTPYPAQVPSGNPPIANPFARIREAVQKQQADAPPQGELEKRFRLT